MSLLHSGPHTVTVFPAIASADLLGRVTLPGDPVTFHGVMVQPVATEPSDLAEGLVGRSRWRVIGTGSWPGGPYCTIRVDAGPPGTQGRIFDQIGEASQRGCGQRTRHFSVLMAAHGKEVS